MQHDSFYDNVFLDAKYLPDIYLYKLNSVEIPARRTAWYKTIEYHLPDGQSSQ